MDVRRAEASALMAVASSSTSVSALRPTAARHAATARKASAMNCPKSIGCVNGPMSEGRKERASLALASLASNASHGSARHEIDHAGEHAQRDQHDADARGDRQVPLAPVDLGDGPAEQQALRDDERTQEEGPGGHLHDQCAEHAADEEPGEPPLPGEVPQRLTGDQSAQRHRDEAEQDERLVHVSDLRDRNEVLERADEQHHQSGETGGDPRGGDREDEHGAPDERDQRQHGLECARHAEDACRKQPHPASGGASPRFARQGPLAP